MLKTLRKIWLFLFVAAAIVAIAVLITQETERFAMPVLVSGRFLALTVLAQLVFWAVAATMWSRVTLATTDMSLSVFTSFRQLALVALGKYLPGKVWGIVARGSEMTAQGVSAQRATVATFYEQFILLHSAVAICAVLFALQQPSWLSFSAMLIAVASVMSGSLFSSIAVRSGAWLAARVGLGFSASDLTPLRSTEYIKLAMGYAIIWILSGVVFLCLYLAFFATPVDLPIVTGLIMANAIAIALGFFAIFAPGAIGVREAIAATVLTAWIPLADAAALAILFRLWTVSMDAIAGFSVLAGIRRRHKG